MTIRGPARAAAASLATALRDPHIGAVEGSWAAGVAGEAALLVVGLLVAYDVAGALGVGILTAARMIPATAVTLFADVARLGRLERVLLVAHLGTAASAMVAAGAVALDAPLVALTAIAAAAASRAIVRPAQLALFPSLAADPAQLLSANVAMSLGEGVGTFAGPLLAGFVTASAGPAVGAAVAAALSLAAAVLVLPVRVAEAARLRPHEQAGGPPVVKGLRTLAERRPAAAVVVSFGLQTYVRGAMTALLVLLAIEVLRAGDAGVGVLNAAIGLGGLLGAAVALGLVGGSRLAPAFSLALVGWGVPLVVIGLLPSMTVAVAALVVLGTANAMLDVTGFTLLQRGVPLSSRGAVFALFESMVGMTVTIGGLVAPLLAAGLGVERALVVTGLLLPIAAVVGWRLVRRLDDEHVVPRRTAALLTGIPLFSLLPLDGLERLAVAMTPVRFEPGEPLMTEGEPGDRYLLIASGSAVVTRGSREARRVGTGDGVGEIALLRSIPRTATVVAMDAVDAFALDTPAFLSAVTGHAGAQTAARAVVAARLEADAVADAAIGAVADASGAEAAEPGPPPR